MKCPSGTNEGKNQAFDSLQILAERCNNERAFWRPSNGIIAILFSLLNLACQIWNDIHWIKRISNWENAMQKWEKSKFKWKRKFEDVFSKLSQTWISEYLRHYSYNRLISFFMRITETYDVFINGKSRLIELKRQRTKAYRVGRNERREDLSHCFTFTVSFESLPNSAFSNDK